MTENIYKYISHKLVILRKTLKLTQQDIADLIGITHQQYQKYETGKCKIRLDRLITICEKLNVDITCFIYGSSYGKDNDIRFLNKL